MAQKVISAAGGGFRWLAEGGGGNLGELQCVPLRTLASVLGLNIAISAHVPLGSDHMGFLHTMIYLLIFLMVTATSSNWDQDCAVLSAVLAYV